VSAENGFIRFDGFGTPTTHEFTANRTTRFLVEGDDIYGLYYNRAEGSETIYRVPSNGGAELINTYNEGSVLGFGSPLFKVGGDFYNLTTRDRTTKAMLRFSKDRPAEEVMAFRDLVVSNDMIEVDGVIYFPGKKDGTPSLWAYYPGCE